jgi:hypothetical protein
VSTEDLRYKYASSTCTPASRTVATCSQSFLLWESPDFHEGAILSYIIVARIAAESRRDVPGCVEYSSAKGRRSNVDSMSKTPWLIVVTSIYARRGQSSMSFRKDHLSIITTEMAAEATRSAVTRPSLLQGSAAFLRATAAFLTTCFVLDISLCAYS